MIRLAGNDTHLLGISREVEHAATVAAAGVGVGPEVTAFIRPEGYLVTRFIEGSPVSDEAVHRPETIGRVADLPPPDPRRAGDPGPVRPVPDRRGVPGAGPGPRGPDPARVRPGSARSAGGSSSPAWRTRSSSGRATTTCSTRTSSTTGSGSGSSTGSTPGWATRSSTSATSAINHEPHGRTRTRSLLAAYDGRTTCRRPDRLARLTLMRIVSDFREAMWGVLQQGISTLDVDFVAYAGEALRPAARGGGHAALRARPAATPPAEALAARAIGAAGIVRRTRPPLASVPFGGWRSSARSVARSRWSSSSSSRRSPCSPGSRALVGASGAAEPSARRSPSPAARSDPWRPADRRRLDRQRVVAPSVGPDPSGTVVLIGAGDIADVRLGRRRARPRTCSSTSRGRSSPPATTPTRTAPPASSPTATTRPGAAFKDRTILPAAGNHDWNTPGAAGYLGYFGTAAAPAGRDLVLARPRRLARRSSSTPTASQVGGCGPDSPQGRWLARGPRGAAPPAARSRSGTTRGSARASTATTPRSRRSGTLLYAAGAELVDQRPRPRLRAVRAAGPERPARSGRAGSARSSSGPAGRSCGRSAARRANSEFRDGRRPTASCGSTLHPANYDWEFLPVTGEHRRLRQHALPLTAGSDAAGPRHGPTTARTRPIPCAHGGPRPGGDHRRRRRRDVDRLPPRRARLDRRRPRRPGGADVRLDVPLGRPRRPAPELRDPDDDDDVRRRAVPASAATRRASTRRGTRSARSGSPRPATASRSSSARRAGRRRSACRSS